MYARDLCHRHYKRLRAHGDPVILPPRNTERLRAQTGSKNVRWVGEEITYAGIHKRVVAKWGRAAMHPCAHCTEQAATWAYNHADPDVRWAERDGRLLPFSSDTRFYIPLCHSCHTRLDKGQKPPREVELCQERGCGRIRHARGWCCRHYDRYIATPRRRARRTGEAT